MLSVKQLPITVSLCATFYTTSPMGTLSQASELVIGCRTRWNLKRKLATVSQVFLKDSIPGTLYSFTLIIVVPGPTITRL